MATPVHIFSNGTEYQYWLHHNCNQCPHSCYNNGQADDEWPVCKIEGALMAGQVSSRQRWFAGYEVPGDCTTWRCRYPPQMEKKPARAEKRAKRQELKDAAKRRQSIIDAGQMEMKL